MSDSRNTSSNDFVVEKQIGQGTFATVYKVLHQNTPYALKSIHLRKNPKPEEEDIKFNIIMREVSIMYALQRRNVPHIPQIYLFQLSETECSILMTLFAKGCYQDAFINNQENTITLKQQLIILKEFLEAISYIFRAGYFHKDIKPQNLLLDENLHCSVGDFGLSNKISNVESGVVGTVLYLSPELLRKDLEKKKAKVTEKTESYSVGLTIWAVLSRREPFTVITSPVHLLDELESGLREEIPAEWLKPIKSMLNRCFDRSPENRPGFGEMLGVVNQVCLQKNVSRKLK